MDPWTKPQHEWAWKHFKVRTEGQGAVRCSLLRSEREGARALLTAIREYFGEVEEKKYKVHVRVFLSRYRGYARVSGLPRLAPAEGGACTYGSAARRSRSSREDEHGRSLEFFDDAGSLSGRESDRRQGAGRSPPAAEVPERRRTALSDAGSLVGDVVRRRGAAHHTRDVPGFDGWWARATFWTSRRSDLHARDTARLVRILEELRDLGNTIIVVEHDADVMRAADHIIDLGPGAGEHGGRVLFSGSYRCAAQGWRRFADLALFERRAQSVATSRAAPQAASEASAKGRRGESQQSEAHRCRHSAGHDGRYHRRVGVGQIDAGP